jgi:hypothetical protein
MECMEVCECESEPMKISAGYLGCYEGAHAAIDEGLSRELHLHRK